MTRAGAKASAWLRARIGPLVSAAITSPRLRDLRRGRFEARRRAAGRPHEVVYFHQVDDPYSALTAQVLAALVQRYDIRLTPHLVPPPEDWAAPERSRLEAYGLKDACAIAPAYGLTFEARTPPGADQISLAQAILCSAKARGGFIEAAAPVSHALWSGQDLTALASRFGQTDAATLAQALASGADQRRRAGHYLGATLLHAGEWYWGVDRLGDLEARLADLGADRALDSPSALAARPELRLVPLGAPAVGLPPLELFLSLRSPYSWLAIDRARALADHYGLTLILRPLLPMVMRGLPVPRAKQLYIVRDCKREAERLGLPFGRVCDPLGEPVERGLAILTGAKASGRDLAFATSYLKGVFAEGIDAGSERGLRRLYRRAGIDASEARVWVAHDAWRAEADANRHQMFDLSLWGVPSFRFGESSTWGQDRLWLLEQAILQASKIESGVHS